MDTRNDEKEQIRQLTEENRQLAAQLQQQAARIQQLKAELERLEKLLAGKADAKAAKKPVFNENYSFGSKRSAQAETTRRLVYGTANEGAITRDHRI